MNTTSMYKVMCNAAIEIQDIWEPKEGDFWYCNCDKCLSSDLNKTFIITFADVLTVTKNVDLNTFHSDVVTAYHTSLDGGFGAYIIESLQEGKRGYVWLPRFDQLVEIYLKHLNINNHAAAIYELDKWLETNATSGKTIEVYLLELLMFDAYRKSWDMKTKTWICREKSDKPSLDDIFKAAQECTSEQNPDMWESKGLNHINKKCKCYEERKVRHLTLNNKTTFFEKTRIYDIITYSQSFNLKEVKELAKKAGFVVEYCSPKSTEYMRYGCFTVKTVGSTNEKGSR